MGGSRRILLSLAVALAALGTASGARADSKVLGTVTDTNGKPLEKATVTLLDAASGRSYKVSSRKDGSFYQRGVLPARYQLRVDREGYTSHIVEDVVVPAGAERHFEIQLRSIKEREAELRKQQLGESYGAAIDSFEKGEFETAIARADRTIAERPEDPRGYDLKAKALISLRRYAEAIPLLEKELTLQGAAPDTSQVLAATVYNAGVSESREERWSEAIVLWEKALGLGYPDPKLLGVLGRAHLQAQNYKRSLELLESYLEKEPTAADAQEVRAILAGIQELVQKR